MKHKSKLVQSFGINSHDDFEAFRKAINPNPTWTAIYYNVIMLGTTYEKAGEPFAMTKMAVYFRLRKAKHDYDKRTAK